MIASRRGQVLDSSRTQQLDRPRQPMPSPGSRQASGLVSQWLGPRMPARRASQEPTVSAFPQAQPPEAFELTQQREAHRQQHVERLEGDRKPRSKQEFLTFFDEWMSEPDDMGEEWWARFDEELKANRLQFPERELP
jgi:hypothetical protein